MGTLARYNQVRTLVIDSSWERRVSLQSLVLGQIRELKRHRQSLALLQIETIDQALSLLEKNSFHLIFVAIGKGDDVKSTIHRIGYLQPFAKVVAVTGDDKSSVVAALEGEIDSFLMLSSENTAPVDVSGILSEVCAFKIKRQEHQTGYVSESPAMQRMEVRLQALAESNKPVLFLGDSGLGKGASARRLHELRKIYLGDKDRPFFNLNVGSIPDELAQSELFGHEPHSFSGAGNSVKPGFLELASNGDIFLDEIGDASPILQLKLLKVVEEREFQRLGGRKTLVTNARFIFATNRNLKELVAQGRFRADLYARISVFPLEMPSLDKRLGDIPHLIREILQAIARDHSQRHVEFEALPDDLVAYLSQGKFPQNIRGIQNCLHQVVLYAQRKPDGELDLRRWRELVDTRDTSVSAKIGSPLAPTVLELNFKEFLRSNTNFLGPDFPGLSEIKQILEDKVLQEAMRKFPHLKERADALKLSKSHACTKLKRVSDQNVIPFKKSA